VRNIQNSVCFLFLIFCLAFLINACSSENNIKRIVAVERSGVELGNRDYNFPPGSYYLMTGVQVPDPLVKDGFIMLYSVPNVEMLLGYFIGKGVEMEEAWIFPPNSCNGLFQVETPMEILVRVSGNQSGTKLGELGFNKLENPTFQSCEGIFSHYTFTKKN